MFSDADNQFLGRWISKDDIEGVFNSSAKNKSLGPDRWGVELFIHFRDLMGLDIDLYLNKNTTNYRYNHKSRTFHPLNTRCIPRNGGILS